MSHRRRLAVVLAVLLAALALATWVLPHTALLRRDPFALRDHAAEVVETHAEYIRAGATVIETWNYSVTAHWLHAQPHLATKTDEQVDAVLEDLLRRSVRLAKQAREQCNAPHVRIAGALPPLGATFDAEDPVVIRTIAARRIAQKLDVRASYEQIARVLNEEGVDHFLIETCAKISFAEAALAACRAANPDLQVWVSMTLQDQAPVVWSGESVAEAVAALTAGDVAPPSAILFNCSPPEVISQALKQLRPLFSGAIGGYANRRGARVRYGADTAQLQKEMGAEEAVLGEREDLEPEAYAGWATDWLTEGGATIIGGCCGVGPSHIQAVAQAVRPTPAI